MEMVKSTWSGQQQVHSTPLSNSASYQHLADMGTSPHDTRTLPIYTNKVESLRWYCVHMFLNLVLQHLSKGGDCIVKMMDINFNL